MKKKYGSYDKLYAFAAPIDLIVRFDKIVVKNNISRSCAIRFSIENFIKDCEKDSFYVELLKLRSENAYWRKMHHKVVERETVLKQLNRKQKRLLHLRERQLVDIESFWRNAYKKCIDEVQKCHKKFMVTSSVAAEYGFLDKL